VADGAITAAKIADGTIVAAEIADDAITTAKILNGNVTSAKMDTNIAVSGTLQGTVITATTGFVPDAQDGAYLGTSSLQFSDLFLADSAAIAFGDDGDVTLTHVHDTGILLNSTMAIQFNDASQYINAPTNAILDINATDEIELNATAIDLNGTLDVSGTGLVTGVLTTGAGIVSDTTNTDALGSASVTWSDIFLGDGAVVNLGEDQDVTLTHVADTGLLLNSTSQLQFNDSSQYIAASSGDDLDIAATTDINLNCTTVDINAAANISGAATITGVLTTGGGIISDTTNTDALGSTSVTWSDAYLGDAAVLAFGEDQDVTFTHVADTGVLLNSTMAIQFNDASQYINAPSNAILDINATDEIELNATLVDINANLEVSGTTTLTGQVECGGLNPISADGAALGSATKEWGDLYLADGAIIHMGLDQDVSITHVADTGILINGASQLQFNDSTQFINAPSGTILDITATDEIELNATTIDCNGILDLGDNVLQSAQFKDYSETRTALSAAATVDVDIEDGNVFTLTPDQNTTFTFSNPAASGLATSFTLIWTQDSSNRTITWPASVDWAGGSAPDVTAGSGVVDIYTFFTIDGGTIWFGFQPGAEMG
ncbi:MAG: hypothetical protein QGH83_03995, partial [Candidatus Pacebacteria bacterium]|nr:hypothetical protein [Candidatus Paceibacterota bacterium]